ncbi:hypothetical protein ACWEP4_28340 [Streptomyces sp. NPDC004227]
MTRDVVARLPFLASIGSTLPNQRELDGEVLVAADDVVLDTYDAVEESGDMLAAAGCGLDRSRISLLGDMPGRVWDRGTGQTIYKSIGSPEQDIALAHAVVEAARAHDLGTPIEPLSSVKQNL